MDAYSSLKDLLEKYRNGTISREEFERFSERMNNPETEAEIKYWMMEHAYEAEDMELPDEDESGSAKSEEQFDQMWAKIIDRDKKDLK